jgi:hypothetical protein
MPDTVEYSIAERMVKAETALATLTVAALALLAAVESGDADEIAATKRRLGLVLADL